MHLHYKVKKFIFH